MDEMRVKKAGTCSVEMETFQVQMLFVHDDDVFVVVIEID